MKVENVLLALVCFTQLRPLATFQLNNAEARLYEDLSTRFRSLPPPRSNTSVPVEIQVSLFMIALNQLDIKHELLTFNGWLSMSWIDESLQWNPSDYDNVDFVLIPASLIWTPDVALNEQLDDTMFAKDQLNVFILPNGTVTCEPGGQITLICPLNLRYFPFDTQTCTVSVTTWSSPPSRIRLTPRIANINLSGLNDEWDITGTGIRRTEDRYAWAIFELKLRMKPLFYIVNVILPIITMSILDITVFLLPPGCGEAVTCAVSIMVAFSVWLLMLSSSLPSTSDNFPLISIYVTVSILVSAVSVIIVILTRRVYDYPESQPVPQWVSRLFCSYLRRHVIKKETKWRMIASAIFVYSFYTMLSLWLPFTCIIAVLFITGA